MFIGSADIFSVGIFYCIFDLNEYNEKITILLIIAGSLIFAQEQTISLAKKKR